MSADVTQHRYMRSIYEFVKPSLNDVIIKFRIVIIKAHSMDAIYN